MTFPNVPRSGENRPEGGLNSVLERNIEILTQRRRQQSMSLSRQHRVALAITRFVGSMAFIYLHVLLFGAWIAINHWPGAPHFDPTLLHLATAASLEAIFLTTFVLITQNRMSEAAEKRAELDVQIGLLTEHELTRLLALNSAIAQHLGVSSEIDHELEELKRDVAPDAVMEKLENADL